MDQCLKKKEKKEADKSKSYLSDFELPWHLCHGN